MSTAVVDKCERVTLRIDGDRPVVDIVGPEDGFPIMVIHGFLATPGIYNAAMESLAHALGARVFSVTRKGYMGTSSPALRDFTHGPDAEFVVAQKMELQRLGKIRSVMPNEPVIVIGHSDGGGTALQILANFADQVKGFVLVSPVGGHQFTPEYFLKWISKRFVDEAARHLKLGLTNRRFRDRYLIDGLSNIRNVRGIAKSGLVILRDGLEGQADSLGERGLEEEFGVLLSNPRDGLMFAKQMRDLSRRLKKEIVLIGEGHSPLLTDPEGFATEIGPRILTMERNWEAKVFKEPLARSRVDPAYLPAYDGTGLMAFHPELATAEN